MVIRKLLILFLVLIIFVVPVSADENVSKSGSIDYSYSQSNSYGLPATVYQGLVVPTIIVHRFTDAKYLDSLYVSGIYERSSGVEYNINDYTTFTATIDGVFYGSGIIGMIEITSADVCFDLEFTYINSSLANSLTGVHDINLNYDSQILSDVTRQHDVSYAIGTGAYEVSLTSSDPTGLDVSMNGDVFALGATYLSSWYTSYENYYDYFYNNNTGLSNLNISKGSSSSKWNVHNLSEGSYFYESSYNTNDIDQTFIRGEQVHANVSFNVDGGVYVNTVLDLGGYDEEEEEDEDEDYFIYNITTELDEYSLGDTVNVTYTTDQKGTIQVVKTISGDIYHSIGFVSGATNATWDFYIAGNEPYGFYDIYLLDSSNSILDSVRYSLLPTTSSLDILQSSVDLHETFVVFAQTVNESILSIEDPNGVEVWNESIGALMYDYIYYTPTIKTGIYTAYLYDDSTLNDTVMVYLADPPIIDDPLDPIVIEDVLEDDESMTEYFDDKFREFAPTAWDIFLLAIVLWLMAILSSFGGSGKRR